MALKDKLATFLLENRRLKDEKEKEKEELENEKNEKEDDDEENDEKDEIDEISTPTLRSYIQKAGKQTKGNQPSDPEKFRKRTNRENGIHQAARKIFGITKVPATK